MASDVSASAWSKALGGDRKQFDMFFNKMLDGFAYHKIIVDKAGKPVDYVFLEVNHAFEKMTGLRRGQIIGKKVTEVLPGIEKDPADWIGLYGKVALTGEPTQFENHDESLGKWYKVLAYSPEKSHFVALLEDITERKKAEDTLKKAKEQTEFDRKRLETILETSPSAVVIIDASSGKFSYINRRAMQLYGFDTLGLSLDENVAKVKARRADGTDYPIVEMPVSRTLKLGQEVHNEEMIIERADGQAFPIVVSTAPLRDMQGNITAAIVVFEDITERKKTEAQILEQLHMLDLAHVIVKNMKDETIFWNSGAQKLYGFSKEEALGKIPRDLLKTKFPIPIKQIKEELLLTGKWEGELVHQKADGRCIFVASYWVIHRDNSGKPVAIIEVNNDITELKKAEEALRESEERWSTTLASIGDAVIATDVSGKIMFMNGEAEDLTGWKLKEALQKPVRAVFHIVNERTRFEAENPIERVLKKGMVVGLANHTVLIRKDGSEVPIDDSGAPIKDKGGKTTGVVLVFRDITERKQQEREIENLAKFPSENPNPIFRINEKGTILYSNLGGNSFLTEWNSKVGEHAPIHIRQVVSDALASNERIEIEETFGTRVFSLSFVPVIVEAYVNIYANDITERKKSEAEREITIKFLRITNTCNDTRGLVKATLGFFQKQSGCEAVGIRLKDGDDYPYYETKGFPPEHVLLESKLCARDDAGCVIRDFKGDPVIECMRGNILCGRFDPSKKFFTEKGSFWANDTTRLIATTTDADRQANTRNRCNREGYESVALLALRVGDNRLGLLQLNDKRKNMFTLETIQVWERIADHLALALSRTLADEALRKSEQEYSSLFANMIDGFAYCQMIFDENNKPVDFVYLQINDSFERITGLKRETVMGKKVSEAIPGTEKANPELFEIYGRVALTCKKEKFEIFFKPLSMWLSVSVYCPMKGYFAAIFEDITERKQSEEALRKLNRHLKAVSNSNQALMRAADESKFTQEVCNIIINDCGYALVWVGFAEHDQDKTVRPVAFAGFDKGYIDALNVSWNVNSKSGRGPTGTVIRTGKPYICKNMQIDPNFEPWRPEALKRGYTASLVLPLTSVEGGTFGALNIYSKESNPFTDEEVKLLTELANDFSYGIEMLRLRKRREQDDATLRKQASLIDLSPDAIIVRTFDGTITFWSKGAEKLYGWTKEEAIGKDINRLLMTEYPHPMDEILKKLKLDGKWSGEIVHTCESGTKLVVQSYWLPKFGSDGKIVEMLESNVDVTQRTQLQTKLEESAVLVEEYANQMEQLANQRAEQLKSAERLAAIGATAGMVGHDIRNPLQAITGDVYLAKTDLASIPESDEKNSALECLQEIEKNVDYINKIVSDLQDYTKTLKPVARETDLRELLDELLAKNGIPENIQVQVKVQKESGVIMADPDILKRIFGNLVINAVQAMPKGGKLTIRACKEAKDSIITVEDTGVGIPEEAKDKLFTPLFTTKSKGQGFGLAVVKRMTEALGGTVSFESEQGKGTTFIIRLPMQNVKR